MEFKKRDQITEDHGARASLGAGKKLAERLRRLTDPKKLYGNLSTNQYFGRNRMKISSYPLVLILRIGKGQVTLVQTLKDFIQHQLSEKIVFLEDHSSNNSYHFSIFCKNEKVLEKILLQPLQKTPLFSNVDGAPLDKGALIENARELTS